MQTIDELKAEMSRAQDINDVEALERCIGKCESLGTPESKAYAATARGSVERIRGDIRAAIEHKKRALILFGEIGDQQKEADLADTLYRLLDNVAAFNEALEYGRRALYLHTKLNDQAAITSDYINLGGVFYQTGDYPKALEYFLRALSLAEPAGDIYHTARAFVNIGGVYDGINNYPSALQYFYRALDLMQKLGDLSSVALITTNLGIVHKNIGNYTKSLEYHLQALNMHEDLGDRSGIAFSINSIGSMYLDAGDHAEALQYFRRGHQLNEELGDVAAVIRSMLNTTSALISLGDIDEAESMLAALETMQLPHIKNVISRNVFRALIQQHHGQLDEAMVTFGVALQMAHEHNYAGSMAWIHEYMRDLCQQRNDLAGYIEHNNEFVRITEEINGKDTATKLALLEAEQKMAKERAEHEKHLSILHSTLPKTIADRVARGETVNDHYDNAAVIFLDIVGFTTISENLSSDQVVQLLEQIFTTLDAVCEKHDVMKIKTIGDSYMAVAFPTSVPHSVRNDTSSLDLSTEEQVISSEARNVAERAASASLDMLHEISHVVSPIGSPIQARIGIHSGAVNAGIIGTTRMQYDVWGDTVNVASRMESTSEPGRIHVSSRFALALKGEMAKERNGETDVIPSVSEEQGVRGGTSSPFPVPSSLIERGALEIKGKGMMTTYWLESAA